MMGIAPPPESGMNEFGKLVEFLADKEALKSRLAEYKEAHERYVAEIEKFQSETSKQEALKKSISEIDSRIASLSANISERETAVQAAEESMNDRESKYGAKVSALESAYNSKFKELESRENNIAAKEETISKALGALVIEKANVQKAAVKVKRTADAIVAKAAELNQEAE